MKQRIAGWLAPLLILMAGLMLGFLIGKDRGLAKVGMTPSGYTNMVAQADGSLILANEPNMDRKAWAHQVDSTSDLIRQIEVIVQPKEDSAEMEMLLRSNAVEHRVRPKAFAIYLSVIANSNGTSRVVASSKDADVLYGKQFTGFGQVVSKRKWASMFSFAGFTRQPIMRAGCRPSNYDSTRALRSSSAATRTAGSWTGAATGAVAKV